MTDATTDVPEGEEEDAKKSSKLPLIIGVVLALVGGGGGFFAVSSGLLPFGGNASDTGASAVADDHASDGAASESNAAAPAAPVGTPEDVSFIELPSLVVSMGSGASKFHLRFQASLEVLPESLESVQNLQPRVIDVMNNYLRALSPADIEAPGALIKIRSQMLRRIQMVTGENRVRDLLIMEFVLN